MKQLLLSSHLYFSIDVPLLDIDINAWLCLTHILETKSMPTKQQILDKNKHFRLETMQDSEQRYLMDDKYAEACDNAFLKYLVGRKNTNPSYSNLTLSFDANVTFND